MLGINTYYFNKCVNCVVWNKYLIFEVISLEKLLKCDTVLCWLKYWRGVLSVTLP